MTTVSIGWNALYRESYLDDAADSVGTSTARDSSIEPSRPGGRISAIAVRSRRPTRLKPRSHGRLALGVRAFVSPRRRADRQSMRAVRSRVVILTLPGLYSTDEAPSCALEIGHLPTFTDNPFVLAHGRALEALRALARDRGLGLVDLDRWSRVTLRPPEEHFVDSVHLDELAQEQAGIHIARAIGPLLPDSARYGPPPAGVAPRP
jgi:hypothetical protein